MTSVWTTQQTSYPEPQGQATSTQPPIFTQGSVPQAEGHGPPFLTADRTNN